jgi:hypothetical protein
MEVTAAMLLFIPETATLGAGVAFADAAQILMLNLTYDVPVKLFAYHLLLLSLFLLAPEIPRILNVFVFNRATFPSTQPPLVTALRGRRLLAAAQIVVGIYFIGLYYQGASRSWDRFGGGAPRPALYGVWDVKRIWIDDVERAPLITDDDRWRRVIISNAQTTWLQGMDESLTAFASNTDAAAKTITLSKGKDKTSKSVFAYTQPRPQQLALEGSMDGHRYRMELQLYDTTKFLLTTRGFNWVQEYPFNR